MNIDDFLQEVGLINWFEHSGEAMKKYHVLYSIFEAYDVWNEQMLKTWEWYSVKKKYKLNVNFFHNTILN